MKRTIFLSVSVVFTFFLFMITGTGNKIHAQEGYEEWKENYLQEFQEFQNEYDRQFYEMLQEEWENINVDLSPDFYNKPKPEILPEEDPDSEPKTTVSLEQPEETEKPIPEPDQKEAKQESGEQFNEQEETESTILENGITTAFEPAVEKAKVETNTLSYFEIPVQYKYYAAYKTKIDQPINQEAISEFWKHLSTKDYPSFLKQLEQVRDKLSLNDYGYAQLLKNIGDQIYDKESPEATLFTWFMLTQSEYGTRIAYNENNIYLLVKTNPGVFKTTYFSIEGTKYYALDWGESQSNIPSELYTYDGDFPKSNQKELDLLFSKRPLLPQQHEERTLTFSYKDTTYSFDVPVDRKIIDYFESYPKADLDLYFNSQLESETHEKLVSSLQPLIEGKSNVEKINILLRFVQRAFDYQTDQEQFNVEKKMFPAETLYYPASDCDDRSILFAWLVEHLTDLDYVILRYPGHLTPAVHFPSNPPEGNPVNYRDKAYYVTDPTYINADAGMIMTDYRNTKPEVYDL